MAVQTRVIVEHHPDIAELVAVRHDILEVFLQTRLEDEDDCIVVVENKFVRTTELFEGGEALLLFGDSAAWESEDNLAASMTLEKSKERVEAIGQSAPP